MSGTAFFAPFFFYNFPHVPDSATAKNSGHFQDKDGEFWSMETDIFAFCVDSEMT